MNPLKPYRNWRVGVIAVLSLFAFIFLVGESDSIAWLIATKAIGINIALITWGLYTYWRDNGQLTELDDNDNEEEPWK